MNENIRKKSIKISLVVNILVVIMTIGACIAMFTGFKFMNGYDKILESTGIGMLRFFTVQSNIFVGVISLLFAIKEIKFLKGIINDIPKNMYILKLMSTSAVGLTFFVVFTYLGPIAKDGIPSMLMNSNLFFHLLIPVISIFNFICFERTNRIKFKSVLYGIIPTFLYGIFYMINILIHMENGKVSPIYDWYWFVQKGVWTSIIVVPMMLAISYIISLIIWRLNMNKKLEITEEWDKVFPKSEKVNHRKVIFKNHFGITLVADLYEPKQYIGKLPAIAVSGPYGAVKEQSSGLYAQEMAERGFLTIAFDPSFTGESGGENRYMTSFDINVEDFQSAVDFLTTLENVDSEKIGIIGICGWGGMALQTACIDTRIKATVVSTMYDMSRVAGNGYFDEQDNEEARYNQRIALNNQRTEDAKTGKYALAGGVVDPLPEDAPYFVKDYYDYYKTKRGYHPRSLNSNNGWAVQTNTSLMNTRLLTYSNEIRNAVMIIHGEKAHSCYMGKDAYNNMIKDSKYTDNKELVIIPNATHTDLYDQKDKIPFDKIESFLKENLK